ncbi:MAG: hypothetical protein AAFR47_21440 [Pseudomonadota bacterium]
MHILNITNGDSAADILKASTVPGDVLPWRDPMHHGPFPAGLSLDELRPLRARYLAGPDGNVEAAERGFRLRDEQLLRSQDYDGVILWFEHDLLDQLQILQILDWFAEANVKGVDLEIICIDRFEGMDGFRGLGELDPVQMASLYDARDRVTEEMIAQAQAGWEAFRSSDPTDVLAFLDRDLTCLPFLRTALLRHLQELPSVTNGLSRTEQQLLALVGDGVQGPVELFQRNMDLETALFIGDWRTYSVLDGLCRAGLLAVGAAAFWYPPTSGDDRRAFRNQRFGLTDLGQRVRSGKADAAELMERDDWLGGVHVRSGAPYWAWDAEVSRPVLRTP